MSLTDKQTEFLASCSHRWNIKTGATRSGKTYLDILAVIPKRILACRGEGLIVLLGNTRGTLERNILDPMRELWGGELVGTIASDNTVRLFGKKVYALGADSKKHVARIQGAAFEYAYGDEITTWSPDVFNMLKSRLSCPHSHFDGTCNPDSPQHWFKKFLDSDADIFRQPYTIDDNGFLPASFVDQLKREYAGTVYYDRFIRGLWVAAEGAIYRPFTDDPAKFIIDTPPEIAICNIGVDFGGGTPSANAFSCTGFTRDFRRMVTLEDVYDKREITPAELEDSFVDFVLMCASKGYPTPFQVYCDSAEKTLIAGLRARALREKLPCVVNRAKKGAINDRIRFLVRMMAQGRYGIMRHCKATQDALAAAVWDPRAVAQDKRLDNGTLNIDSLDSMEYTFEPFINVMTALF